MLKFKNIVKMKIAEFCEISLKYAEFEAASRRDLPLARGEMTHQVLFSAKNRQMPPLGSGNGGVCSLKLPKPWDAGPGAQDPGQN